MRIIAGVARGIILDSLDGDETRPTLDRVKENFFNAINFELAEAKVLDLFAGTGQFGLEALSRGAKEAVFVDSNAKCVEIIKKNGQKTKLYEKCKILKCDYSDYLTGLTQLNDFEKFDIIFIDPPYKSGKRQINECINKILENEFVSDGGFIIFEMGGIERFNLNLGAEIADKITKSRVYKYGKIYITILKVKTKVQKGENDGK